MGRHIWGETVGALVLAVTVAAASGCSSSDGDSEKPAAKPTPRVLSVGKATTTFQAAVEKFDADGGCLEQAPGTCWEQMQALMKPARDLRKAANADKKTGPEFWSKAYALIDTMEDGIAVGEDKGVPAGGASMTNRDDVLGSAHDLSDWLDENPVA
ncbi:hypothetical protein SAMN05216483_6800 [Streptomyces sp. 2131.1]|uniref:hypothetical protein n=1 Tax=Streptomyces sp. 2131.1 TaxID=1855346 RepID=UPI00089AA51E|nr:hypothetical protein [Streptomyces sp. 2131.1]SEE85357.1 hypothetical protein SAMN05216483_6800 [Streptomyces sp. 2131.1]